MEISELPQEVQAHLPNGYESSQGVWLVLPTDNGTDRSISAVNTWLRAEDWYPPSLKSTIWFGDDGVGNFLGWDALAGHAILWNPEDGDEPWRTGNVADLWGFIVRGYAA